ncbi:MAG: hypothetical protein FWF13_06385 [Acidobacteria bacterium]|nr:hypothetical protein [Acidobacteriota bacterium]
MTVRRLLAVIIAGLLVFMISSDRSEALQEKSDAQEKENEARKQPIAPAGGEVGNLLRGWYSGGNAAGNIGDYYDNRDGGHSPLNLARHPQLQQIPFTEAQIKARANWGRQTRVLPNVVIGNSSTAYSATAGGSNARASYINSQSINLLYSQYTRNNLYVYPEHQDYDPGHNGVGGGYGDLFPINTPYLIISQGSSGSDQTFLRAVAYTLAAFRPDVKEKLKESGFLMPTIQMLLRISSRGIATSAEYLTGKAHPPVFRGNDVSERKMVEMAHGITLSNLPPMARIHAAREDEAVFGRDFFEPGKNEKLADTPAAVGRIFRGSAGTRKITIDASDSKDLNGKPLKFFWSVLQGDASRITISHLNPEQSIAEITVPHFDRFIVDGRPGLVTNRIDIGVFVHNGTYYSPPAFLTFYMLDSEDRTYASDGKIVDIGYNAGTASISVADWAALLKILKGGGTGWPARLLRERFSVEELSALSDIADEFARADAVAVAARIKYDAAVAAQKAAQGADKDKEKTAVAAARKVSDDARKAGERILEKKLPKRDITAAALIQKILNELTTDAEFASANDAALEQLMSSTDKKELKELDAIRESLASFGVLRRSADGFELNPVRQGNAPISERLTRFEKGYLARLNAALLARVVFPKILRDNWRANFVDNRLDSPKGWRDVYNYAPDGTPLGWTRYLKDGIEEFNAEGLLVMEKDAQGRCVKARPVRYEKVSGSIKATPTGDMRTYRYSGPADWKGKSE